MGRALQLQVEKFRVAFQSARLLHDSSYNPELEDLLREM